MLVITKTVFLANRPTKALFFICLLLSMTGICGPGSSASAQNQFLFLPLVNRDNFFISTQSVFGIHMEVAINETWGLSQAVQSGARWVRFDAFEWDRIEPELTSPFPTYRWDVVDEASLINAARNGMTLIGVVKYTPPWAQKYPGSFCGPIKTEAFDHFAAFLSALVNRYKNPPYNIKYWEIGNEPDAPIWPGRTGYGCWGDWDDYYFGGEHYAKALKAAYPAVKAADPTARVLIGGLLLDNPYEATHTTARFFDGVLRAGGGPFFDIVSFHGYSYFQGTVGRMANLNWPGSSTAVTEKTLFINHHLSRHNLGRKDLMYTETALICEIETEDCLKTQAIFIPRAFAEALALGLTNLIYFSLKNDYLNLGLFRMDDSPRLSYQAYKTASFFLNNVKYLRAVSNYPTGIAGHSFLTATGRNLDLIWSADGNPQSVSLPAGTSAYDLYGTPIPPGNGTIIVNYEPVYIQ